MSYRESFEEKKMRNETMKCAMLAVAVVVGALSLLIYGMAWLSSAEKVSAEIYGAKHLEGRIKWLEKEHVHIYSTGKPNKPKGF